MINIDRIDWNHLSDTDLAEIQAYISDNLTKREIAEIDFRMTGNLILAWSRSLSVETNKMLQIIAEWIDDPHFMERYKITDVDGYDWAKYKQQQRQFTEDQRQAMAERMREAWKEIRARQKLRDELSGIIPPRSSAVAIQHQHNQSENDLDDGFMSGSSELMGAFSPVEQNKADLEHDFQHIREKHLSDIVPWRAILLSEIYNRHITDNNRRGSPMEFTDLTTYTAEPFQRTETVAKFIHLLQMQTDQLITLSQSQHLSPITIIPNMPAININHSAMAEIIDRIGNHSEINLLMLSEGERMSLVNQAVNTDVIIR